jgi:hypothetical protein
MSELTYGQKARVWQWSTRRAPVGYYRVGAAASFCAKLPVLRSVDSQFAELERLEAYLAKQRPVMAASAMAGRS